MEVKSVVKRFLAKEAEENIYVKEKNLLVHWEKSGHFVTMNDNPKLSGVKQRKKDNAIGKYCPKNIIQKMLWHRLKS